MTIANIIVFVLVMALAFLLLAYASREQYQVKLVRKLPAPPDRVWEYLSRPEMYSHWSAYVTDCNPIDSDASGVGTRRRVVMDLNPAPGEREEEITRWEDGKTLELRYVWEKRDGKPVRWKDAHVEYRLRPDEDGTSLTSDFRFSGTGALGRVFSLLSFRKRLEKEHRQSMDNLERRLREETYPA